MGAIANTLNASITAEGLAGTIPNVGAMFVVLIVFSIGLMIFRRILRGASKAKAKV